MADLDLLHHQPGTATHVGYTALWGPEFTETQGRNTSAAVTQWSGVSGVDGTGWYFKLDKGAPEFLRIGVHMLMRNHTVYVALPYPAGTTFNVFVNSTWWTGYRRNTTEVDSPAKVWAGDGYKWHFNGKHLFLKMHNLVADPSRTFTRDGAHILGIEDSQKYEITAKCPAGTVTADGFCTLASDSWPTPSSYWTSIP
jgi:hypothetical protein